MKSKKISNIIKNNRIPILRKIRYEKRKFSKNNNRKLRKIRSQKIRKDQTYRKSKLDFKLSYHIENI